MKRKIALSGLAVALVFLLPLVFTVPRAGDRRSEDGTGQLPAASADAATVLAVRTAAGTREMTLAEYLPLALAGEMPAVFEPEALQAQAVALRTYALYYRAQRKPNHPEADICTEPGCCAAFAEEETLRENWGENYDAYREKLRCAVEETDGEYLTWDDAPALAVFHASSYVSTEDGAALGLSVPYLERVETPETAALVRNLRSTVEVSREDFRTTVLAACPDAVLEGDAANWVGGVQLNASGRVAEALIGGAAISGLTLRQMFSLRSTDFTLAWDGERQSFLFRVNGYGHGLGMSQYGAELMAGAGADHREILAHYYPGTQLARLG